MKEKVLRDLKKIAIDQVLPQVPTISKDANLVDLGSVIDVKSDNSKTVIIIDLDPLGITRDQAILLEKLLIQKLPKSFFRASKFAIIFTSSGKPPISKIEQNKAQKPEEKVVNNSSEKSAEKPAIAPVVGVKNIIAIASGKGGVGKSTVAVNLALSLKRIGFNVGLVDGDVYGPSIPHMMNLQSKPEIENNLMIPIKSYGISCISVGSLIDKDQALVWRGPMISKTLYQLIRGVNWFYEKKEIDYLIIDMPPGTGDVHLSLAQQYPISGAIIVSTPQDVAVIDAVKAIDMFNKLHVPIIGLVQNMAFLEDKTGQKTYLFGQDKAKKLAEKQNIKFLGDIELDIKIREGGDERNPIVNSYPSSKMALAYGRIVENILDFF